MIFTSLSGSIPEFPAKGDPGNKGEPGLTGKHGDYGPAGNVGAKGLNKAYSCH